MSDVSLDELTKYGISSEIVEKLREADVSSFNELMVMKQMGNTSAFATLSEESVELVKKASLKLVCSLKEKAFAFVSGRLKRIRTSMAARDLDELKRKVYEVLVHALVEFLTHGEVLQYLKDEDTNVSLFNEAHKDSLVEDPEGHRAFVLLCDIKSTERKALKRIMARSVKKPREEPELAQINYGIETLKAKLEQVSSGMAKGDVLSRQTAQIDRLENLLTKRLEELKNSTVSKDGSATANARHDDKGMMILLKTMQGAMASKDEVKELSKYIKEKLPCGNISNSVAMSVSASLKGAIEKPMTAGFQGIHVKLDKVASKVDLDKELDVDEVAAAVNRIELEKVRSQNEDLQKKLDEANQKLTQVAAVNRIELEKLRSQNEDLQKKLDEANQKVAQVALIVNQQKE